MLFTFTVLSAALVSMLMWYLLNSEFTSELIITRVDAKYI